MGAVQSNFETIWRTYEKELSSYVLSRVGDSEIQKEIMQEAALKIYTSLHTQKDHLRGWLYRIVKNTMADYFRKQGKPLPKPDEPTQDETYPIAECLAPVMARLSKQEREILELTQIQQYSLREVAEQKKIPLNTAKSQLFRAKKALAKRLFSCCEYERNAKGEVTDYIDKEGGVHIVAQDHFIIYDANRHTKGNSMKTKVQQTNQGVKINFSNEVQEQTIVNMVENCASGQCECMNDKTKANIKDMKINLKEGFVTLEIDGAITKEEIEAALAKSKVIHTSISDDT